MARAMKLKTLFSTLLARERGFFRRLRICAFVTSAILLLRIFIVWTAQLPFTFVDPVDDFATHVTFPESCLDITKPKSASVLHSNGSWQVHRDGPDEIFVVSAFYDNRSILRGQWSVRVMALARPTPTTLYCQIWFDGQAHPLFTNVTVTKSGRGDVIRGVTYGQYMYSCPLNNTSSVPTHVSIATSRFGRSTILLPVVKPSPYAHKFGVCVPIAFGNIAASQVAEWMELLMMFGVTEVNVYNGTMTSDLRSLFNYYENTGFLRVFQMPPPVNKFDKIGAKLSSPASLNDCMYRNMYRYKLIVLLDFDELIVPREHSNYHDMLDGVNTFFNIKQDDLWWSYSFRNAYFFHELEKYQEVQAGTADFMTIRYRHRAKPSRFLYATKSMVDPRRCLSVFNHYCYVHFPGTPRQFTLDVPAKVALSHHYRTCNQGAKKCRELFAQNTSDDTMLQYKDEVQTRVKKVISQIGH